MSVGLWDKQMHESKPYIHKDNRRKTIVESTLAREKTRREKQQKAAVQKQPLLNTALIQGYQIDVGLAEADERERTMHMQSAVRPDRHSKRPTI